jgi:rhodanese-related sulfurtransferase
MKVKKYKGSNSACRVFLASVVLTMIVNSSFAANNGPVVLPIVSAKWLAENRTEQGLVILHVAPVKRDYNSGHIPGAKNLPQTELYDSRTFQFIDAGKLSEAFKNLKIPAGGKPVFYCHTGNQASVAYVAALAAGYDPIIYEGSMEEWMSRTELPVEK